MQNQQLGSAYPNMAPANAVHEDSNAGRIEEQGQQQQLPQVAQPVYLAPGDAALMLNIELKDAVRQLDRCQSQEEFIAIQNRVAVLMNQVVIPDSLRIQDPTDRLQVIVSMRNTAQHLRSNGHVQKAKRIEKIVKILENLPTMSPKKQRKALRKVLRLTGKNVGVNVGNTGLCGYSVCCNVACVAGGVVLLGGLVTVITLAALVEFDQKPDVEELEDILDAQEKEFNKIFDDNKQDLLNSFQSREGTFDQPPEGPEVDPEYEDYINDVVLGRGGDTELGEGTGSNVHPEVITCFPYDPEAVPREADCDWGVTPTMQGDPDYLDHSTRNDDVTGLGEGDAWITDNNDYSHVPEDVRVWSNHWLET